MTITIPSRSLLRAVRKAYGHTLTSYINAVADRHTALGFGHMARNRAKVCRWQKDTEPEMPAQLAMADLHRVDPKEVKARGWPNWLLLALPGPDVLAPFTPEVTLSALDDLAADPARANAGAFPLLPADVLADLAERWTEHVQGAIAQGVSGGYVGGEVSTAIHARLTGLWHLDDSLGGAPCATSARSDLTMVTRLLRHSRHTGQLTADLHFLAAEYARFLGWAEFDAGNTAAAQRAWHVALRASAESPDPAHSAYLLANLALACIYDNQPATGTAMLASARDIAGSRTTPLVAAMIDTWRVRAAAASGDARQAVRLLQQAETEFERARAGDTNPAWAYWMCRPSHMAETGRAFLDLGDPVTAETLLSDGLAGLKPGEQRDRVLYLTWIATCQARQHNLDAAAHTATAALDSADRVESGRCTALLTSLAAELTPHQDAASVGIVLERLNATAL
ncbi:transcriptional regulator [Streptomyces sp. JV176]|uniref:transcriptional regulator n=1 Tax=Streptomyces sp. JV176 TaxID=858630 RepID=UPI002E79FEC9|nr:transcriptional regulator [Streptomyces sp. JV176]MEE1798096.1 transcriptional regulator [Streptomyces sp. JV176]